MILHGVTRSVRRVTMFRDRRDAGAELAELVAGHDVDADIVLAIPRGGLPVGRAVADELDVPLDVVVARKIGSPHNPELAIGAVAADGSAWLNEGLIDELGVGEDYVDRKREEEAENARQKAERYRGDRPAPDFEGKSVVVVDDGVATGATAIACLRQVRAGGAERVVLAVPVGSPDTAERLHDEADDVICAETPPHFQAVGQFYDDFGQVSDQEAMTHLEGESSREE
jgi:predicted phosphoribosyltransferase